jgi:UDP-4-amino-4,6-dideoxy-L-N-acetyl-beta-L-altrosamine transaminase
MISYGKQYIDKNDINNVTKTLKSSYLTQGPNVIKFENKLCKILKSKKALCVSSGSAALHIAGKSLGWKKGDKIVSSPITFLAGTAAALHCGASPEFVDIDKNTFNMDNNKLENKLKKDKKIKAVIITDFAGQPANWEDLFYLKKKYKIDLINDNCHSLGSKYKNNIGYASKYADLSCLSFHPVKHITTGEGGAIITNNSEIYNKCKSLRSHGIIKKNKFSPWYYEMQDLGFNYRLSDIHATLGLSQIQKLNKFVTFRNKVAKKYEHLFSKISGVTTPFLEANRTHSYHLYVLQIDFKKIKKTKEQLFRLFKKNNINLQVHYIPIFLQPYIQKKYKLNKSDFPNSIDYYKKSFSIPIYYNLNDKIIFKVSRLIKRFLKI